MKNEKGVNNLSSSWSAYLFNLFQRKMKTDEEG